MRRQVQRMFAVLAAVIGLTVAVATPVGAAPTVSTGHAVGPVKGQSSGSVHANLDWWW